MGAKAAHEAYVLVKDKAWSERLARYAGLLPELQRGLPVPDEYKQEEPGSNADLGAYDVVYYAGDSNAGSKTIAINLPNDEEVQLQKGSRRLQLKNAMRAKFDQILEPIADELIVPEQRQHVTFDAFLRQHHVPRGRPTGWGSRARSTAARRSAKHCRKTRARSKRGRPTCSAST